MQGEVLGFRGCTVYSKCDELASALDVCLSLALLQSVEAGNYKLALQVVLYLISLFIPE